ncbi:hypothetical protein AGMMS50249_6860 [candidate division SR1 bacterium]|nr:hypothetical protein AGMMS50249_6860 [candidate division SR1 bacterium]
MESLVLEIIDKLPHITAKEIKDLQRDFAKKNKMQTLPSKSDILQAYFALLKDGAIEENAGFELLLKKRAIRSMSGIVSVQVLTKPRGCPGQCIFCPNDPSMPKSYIKSEPGASRAFLNQFDPVKQVWNRLQSLTLTGHKPEKIEMIVLGGSRDAYDEEYKESFMKGLYDACNSFGELEITVNNPSSVATLLPLPYQGENISEKELIKIMNQSGTTNESGNIVLPAARLGSRETDGVVESKRAMDIQSKYGFQITNEKQIQNSFSASLKEAIEKNETAKHRIIGLTIETRPDLVNHENCQKWRTYGVTRIEMGVQSTDDEVLKMNKRGHLMKETRDALHILRMYGFKISLHVMPGLYGSCEEKDIQSFITLFSDSYLKPDELKIYPTSVIPGTELYNLWKEGKYTPISTAEIVKIIEMIFREVVPPYTRIKRLIRDIPATEIEAGSSITNLAQLVHERLLKEYRNDNKGGKIKDFYARLYENDELISTEIIGEKPDITSFRNFVSLDTRSREVRHKFLPNSQAK